MLMLYSTLKGIKTTWLWISCQWIDCSPRIVMSCFHFSKERWNYKLPGQVACWFSAAHQVERLVECRQHNTDMHGDMVRFMTFELLQHVQAMLDSRPVRFIKVATLLKQRWTILLTFIVREQHNQVNKIATWQHVDFCACSGGRHWYFSLYDVCKNIKEWLPTGVPCASCRLGRTF